MHPGATRNQMPLLRLVAFSIVFLLTSFISYSQTHLDSLFRKIDPQKWSTVVEKKLSKLEDKIISKSEKTLQRSQREEERIYKKQLTTKDSLVAKAKLAEIQTKYKELEEKFKNPSSIIPANARQYLPHLDTLKTALKFLDQQNANGNVKNALSKIESFETKMQQAEEIKKFIRERRDQLKQQLEQLGLVKGLKKYNKQIFYYDRQIQEYKKILSDPKKIERKAIELLSKTRVFQDFMRRNSMLASLFRMPGDPNDPTYIASLAGLQTRTQVNNLIQQQVASAGPNGQAQFRQNIQQAQSQLQQLKNKVTQFGGGSSDDIMPEGFKPNNQRTKSFWQKWEMGVNVQSNRANGLLPVSSDLGVSAGFKPNDIFIAGVGLGGSIGWGRDIRHIAISYQGVSGRFFTELKLKGSFHAAAGFEMNYLREIRNIDQLKDYSAWQKSGLVGLSKVVSIKSKFFKKTKLQLLWNFLSYSQRPRVSQPVLFRIGYNF
jgi:hypothetical protein